MSGDERVSDRRTVLRAIGTVAGLGSAGLVSAGDPRSARRAGEQSGEKLGEVDVPGAAEAVPGESGAWTYVATGDGFAVVDTSDPTSPTVAATRSVADIGGILDLDLDEGADRLSVPGPANGGGGTSIEHPGGDPGDPSATSGFGLYDISDPSDPVHLATFETDYAIHNCYHQGETVYLVDNSTAEMVVVDVADDDPTEVARWGLSGAGILHDLFVQDGVAYCAYWDQGTAMVDVSDPVKPSLNSLVRAGSSREPNNDHYVMPDEDGTVLAIGKEQLGYSNLGVELWDISDATDTSFLAEVEPPADPEFGERTSHNLDFSGDYLYTSWYAGGVRVHDIGDPSNPEEVSSWQGEDTQFWTAKVADTGAFFVASDYATGGLYTFDDPQGGPGEGLTVSTEAPTEIGADSATLNGALTDINGADSATVWFEWGEPGSGTPNATGTQTLTGTGEFEVTVDGLDEGTVYEFRAYAETSNNEVTAGLLSFITDDPFSFPCFITTATADDTETLDSLRRFRDESMTTTPVGRGMVGLYYRISPPIARTLERHPDSTETALTRRLVETCAGLSDRQAATDSRSGSAALGVLLTTLYVVGILVGMAGHASLRLRETLGT